MPSTNAIYDEDSLHQVLQHGKRSDFHGKFGGAAFYAYICRKICGVICDEMPHDLKMPLICLSTNVKIGRNLDGTNHRFRCFLK
jgi:hypothetical protein